MAVDLGVCSKLKRQNVLEMAAKETIQSNILIHHLRISLGTISRTRQYTYVIKQRARWEKGERIFRARRWDEEKVCVEKI